MELSKPHGIIMLGANGSGKSTLGRELARMLNFIHLDVEDYWFYKTDIPYTAIRPQEERNGMLLSDMKKHGSFVVSGDISGWGDEFLPMFDLAIFLTAPTEIRIKRIENREYARWGERVCEGGDMYESQTKFREFAATRDVALLEQGALKYACPILQVDGTQDIHETIKQITQQYYTIPLMGIAVRAAVEDDAAELKRLNIEFNGEGNVTDESIARSIRDNDQEQVFIAECGDRLIGFCCVQLFKSFCYGSNYAEITELFVDEQHRRNAVATRLMGYAESHYSDKNIVGFQLFTGGKNASAQKFYESLGYLKTDEIMYRKGESLGRPR
jgi:ribosomal protein S18 acetylase RimI-like enzyme/cytidylate kinase